MGKWGKVTVMKIWMFCGMLLGRICCRDLKNVVVVEDGIKLGGEKIEDLVSSYSSFGGDIVDNFEEKNTVSGIKYGKR